MKKVFILCSSIIFISFISYSQTNYLPYTNISKSSDSNTLYRNIELSVGYIPKSDQNALKGNISINNLLLKRLGIYSSIEKKFNTNNLTNTIGATASLHHFVYLWGGIDFFTKNGVIQTGSFAGSRKEIGIGLLPYKKSVLRFGWSSSVGISISAGLNITF